MDVLQVLFSLWTGNRCTTGQPESIKKLTAEEQQEIRAYCENNERQAFDVGFRNHGMKEAIIYLLFDNWCNSGHEPEVIEAMKKAIQNPTEDTIFELSSTVEANAFKAGVRSCLQMMHCLFIEE